jgi:ketosteroid isomerase-like protein
VSGANEPQQLHELFAKFFNSQDVDGLLSLYEPDGAMLIGADQVTRGINELRQGFAAMVSMGMTIEFGDREIAVEVGELALSHGSWKFIAQDGTVVTEARTAEVCRRGEDGVWRYVLDNPFGTALLDPA